MPESKKQLNFFWIAAGIILLFAVLIVLHWSEISTYRQHKIDSLLTLAGQQNNDEAKFSYLQQAQLVDIHDPLAVQALAQFWMSRGEVDKAIEVYRGGIDNPNYTYLGNMALRGQDYTSALRYFQKANGGENSASGLIGESSAYFNLDKITEGCNKALLASKSDLSSESAKDLLKSCVVLGGNNSEASQLANINQLTDRQVAYLLLQAKVYKQAEQKLLALPEKATSDYLVLARLSAARGDIKGAIEFAEKGVALNKADIELNKALIQYYSINGDSQNKTLYQNRLEELQTLESIR